jgi:ribonuclease HI
MKYSLTAEALALGSRNNGGFKHKQFQALGADPRVKGWMHRLVERPILEEDYRLFLKLSDRNYSANCIEEMVNAMKTRDFSGIEIPEMKCIYRQHFLERYFTAKSDLKDIIIYTDGSCLSNPGGKGGWAFIASWNGKQLSCAGFAPKTTNNRMELTAAIEALTAIQTRVEDCKGRIMVYTDSIYVFYCVAGYRKWLAKKKKNIKNFDMVNKLVVLSESMFAEWGWVRGHSGNPMNEQCDVMAETAANLQQSFTDYVRKGL